MKPKKIYFLLLLLTLFYSKTKFAQENRQMVRIAKLLIVTNQLGSYKAALTEEIKISVSLEPGVLTLYRHIAKPCMLAAIKRNIKHWNNKQTSAG